MSATIHFFIRADRPGTDQTAQIYLLFTINRKSKTKISLHKKVPLKKEFLKLSHNELMKVSPELRSKMFCWDIDTERVTKQTPSSEKINRFLDAEKKRANDIILKYELMGKPLTVEVFKRLYSKQAGNQRFAEYFLNEFETQSNRWAGETLRSYKSIITKIQKFRPSLTLNDINHRFLSEYENYMLKPAKEGGCGNCLNTSNNNMKTLKTLLLLAIRNGDFLKENYPFDEFKITETSKELTTRDYLEPEELGKLEKLFMDYEEPIKKLKEISPEEWREREQRGIISPGEYKALRRFLFSCYTGLRFRDMLLLELEKHIFIKTIEIPESNEKIKRFYIELNMHKTQNTVVIPLIDKASKLIDFDTKGRIFEPITNQKINLHLKNIQVKSGINKHLTFHVSRHSFATICFLYGISEKVGQQLLGHKNRKFTEIYTHLSSHKIFLEMDKFNIGINRLNNKKEDTNKQSQNKLLELLPLLESMSPDKLEQLKGFLKFLG